MANVSVVEGKFFGVAEALPDPDRVFVGGGGREAGRIVERCLARLRPGGRIVVSAVLEETIRQLGDAGLKPHLHECVEVAVRRSVALAHSHVMRPLNAVRLFVFEKPGVP
ncbi:MAG: hypothetical protein D6781_00885 [Verrucomicrobia bacterium]|nr:MAG: hypothetical protein D6781_00885 [Verrucomicrobiota bacterium]